MKCPEDDGLFQEIEAQSVDFSHEEGDAANSSLELFPVSASWVPEHFSYAAYSISEAQEAVEKDLLKVWARFYKDTPKGSVQIRTVNVTPEIPDELSKKVFQRYAGQGALGEIKPTRVFFGNSGQSVYRGKKSNVPLKISGSKFPELGVGIYDIVWRWDYRTLSSKSTDEEEVWSEKWIPFESSMHRIFITLDSPKSPWSPHLLSGFNDTTSNDSPLWTEALYIACKWASGSKTIEEAGKKIADGLYNSGKFAYHPDSHYAKENMPSNIAKLSIDEPTEKINYFYLSKVIERILGGNGFGEKVNCLDCSLIVAALTNALGGNLQTGKLQHSSDTNYADPEIVAKNRFEIKDITAIGRKDVPTTMKDLESDGRYFFSYHSIAWQPVNDESPNFDDPNNTIYDACVQFSEDEQTASGIPLGELEDESGYRAQLATPTDKGVECCLAQTVTVRKIQLL